jgi:hypothetical protein
MRDTSSACATSANPREARHRTTARRNRRTGPPVRILRGSRTLDVGHRATRPKPLLLARRSSSSASRRRISLWSNQNVRPEREGLPHVDWADPPIVCHPPAIRRLRRRNHRRRRTQFVAAMLESLNGTDDPREDLHASSMTSSSSPSPEPQGVAIAAQSPDGRWLAFVGPACRRSRRRDDSPRYPSTALAAVPLYGLGRRLEPNIVLAR